MTLELLNESTGTLRSHRVDRANGVIRGVKILGLESGNGRTYSREAVGRARSMYEGAKVNIDHPGKPGESRSARDRLGVFRGVEQRNDGGLYGDLHYLKSHPLAESVCEDAERGLGAFGMSQNAQGKVVSRGGKNVVEEINSVASVDLVGNPATTSSLFESVSPFHTPEGKRIIAEAVEAGRKAMGNRSSDAGNGDDWIYRLTGRRTAPAPQQLAESKQSTAADLREAEVDDTVFRLTGRRTESHYLRESNRQRAANAKKEADSKAFVRQLTGQR